MPKGRSGAAVRRARAGLNDTMAHTHRCIRMVAASALLLCGRSQLPFRLHRVFVLVLGSIDTCLALPLRASARGYPIPPHLGCPRCFLFLEDACSLLTVKLFTAVRGCGCGPWPGGQGQWQAPSIDMGHMGYVGCGGPASRGQKAARGPWSAGGV